MPEEASLDKKLNKLMTIILFTFFQATSTIRKLCNVSQSKTPVDSIRKQTFSQPLAAWSSGGWNGWGGGWDF